MTPATRTRLRSATAVAVALISIAATFPASAATVTKQHYQRQAQLICGPGAGCVAALPQLPANQALDIDHVVCDVNMSGHVVSAALFLIPGSLNFTMPLGLIWQRSDSGNNFYTFGSELNVRVPLGRQAGVGVLASVPAYGFCSFTGTLLINS